MGLTTYRATALALSTLRRLLRLELRVSGLENLTGRPTVFVPNHFTRFETVLVPYALHLNGRPGVRTLAASGLFKGFLGRYLETMGVISTRDPRRNRMIVGELMTCAGDWVIYPEGALVKSKQTLHEGRLWVQGPERRGPPHTGAAMMALKAQMCKRGFKQAHQEDDLRRIEYYEECFALFGTKRVCLDDIVMTPVTLTFYPMRPSRNLVNRVAKLFVRDLDPRLEEEIQVEGSLLLAGAEVAIHFGRAIEVREHAERMIDLAERYTDLHGPAARRDVFMRHQARRLTDACVRAIYENIEINFDHLFCCGLRVCERDRIAVGDFQKALRLAARDLAATRNIRLHPALRGGEGARTRARPLSPWDSILALARREGSVRIEKDDLVIDRAALQSAHDYHTIRLRNMTRVIANEMEPLHAAVAILRRRVNQV